MLEKILKKSSAADLAKTAARARAAVGEKAGAVAAAEAAVVAALDALDADRHANAAAATAAARAALTSAEAFAEAAEARHAEAVAAEADETWRREATAHDRAVSAFERQARADLEAMGATARRLVGRSAELEATWRDLNARRPADAEPPRHPESWRHLDATAEEVVAETVASEWCFCSTGQPLGPDAAKRVTPHEGGRRGWLGTGSGVADVERRKVRRRTVRPRRPVERAAALATAIAIPGATAADRPGWSPVPPDEVATAIAHLAMPMAPRVAESREVVEVIDG